MSVEFTMWKLRDFGGPSNSKTKPNFALKKKRSDFESIAWMMAWWRCVQFAGRFGDWAFVFKWRLIDTAASEVRQVVRARSLSDGLNKEFEDLAQ